MVKTERLDLKVYKVGLDPLDQWVTRDQLGSLEKMEFLVLLEILGQEEILEKMVHLVSMDPLVLQVLLERGAHLVLLVQEVSRECQDHLENQGNLEKMVWLDCLDNQV